MNRNKIIILGITSIFLLIIATLGFAYGYYSSFIRKIDQSKKITVTSGNSQITYIASLNEEETLETIKPGISSVEYFAVQNTGNVNAMYFIYLDSVINTFTNTEDITYSIYRTKGNDKINFDYIDIDTLNYETWEVLVSDEIYPTKNSLLKETKETITGKNEYYIYALVVNYKYRLDKDQSIDSEHIFGGELKLIPTDNIDTENVYEKGTLAYEIINNSFLNLNGTNYNTSTIENLLTDTSAKPLLSLTEDNYGISYYYRNNVKDNYVNFANKCFRIVRILGDGSIKLALYDNNSTCNESIKDMNMPLLNDDDVIIEKTYIEEIKNELNDWYSSDIYLYEDYIKLNNWCIDNSEQKYSSIDNTMIDNLETYSMLNKDEEGYYKYNYGTKKRINENLPTLKCDETNLNYESYIGLLTAEEIIYNHNNGGINNKDYNIATSSLSHFDSKYNTDFVYTYALNEISTTNPLAINPSLVLKSGIKYLKGNGTINDAYEINLEV